MEGSWLYFNLLKFVLGGQQAGGARKGRGNPSSRDISDAANLNIGELIQGIQKGNGLLTRAGGLKLAIAIMVELVEYSYDRCNSAA